MEFEDDSDCEIIDVSGGEMHKIDGTNTDGLDRSESTFRTSNR
jgi:hypothetical protein